MSIHHVRRRQPPPEPLSAWHRLCSACPAMTCGAQGWDGRAWASGAQGCLARPWCTRGGGRAAHLVHHACAMGRWGGRRREGISRKQGQGTSLTRSGISAEYSHVPKLTVHRKGSVIQPPRSLPAERRRQQHG